MKRILKLITFVSLSTMLYAQCDVQGNFRVSALDVQYYDIARQTTDINVNDAYGLGIQLTLAQIYAGDVFYGTHSGPYNQAALDFIGVNLNVNFNDDCTASLAEGSFYPDVEEDNCVTSVQVLPIQDDMIFSSDMTTTGSLPMTNLIGFPSISARAYAPGFVAGGLSLDQALIFDYFPQGPTTGPGQITIPTQINNPATGELMIPANYPLPGTHGGWMTENPGPTAITTSTTDPDLFGEWHAIDGAASGSGFGDFTGEDEDGFDGDFDRTFGLPVLPEATYFNPSPACAVYGTLGSQPIAGDVTGPIQDGVTGVCYDTVLAGIEGGCYDAVIAGVAAQCEYVGGVANTVFGGCVEQANGDDFAAGCAYYGVTAAVGQACVDAGGPNTIDESLAMGLGGMTCWDIGGEYDYACGGDCACAVAYATTSCADSGGASLCCLAGGIGEASSGGDCTAFASSFSEETLNGYALALNGATCPDTAAYYAAMYAAGDPGTIAELDAMAAGVVGMSCPDYGAAFIAGCVAAVDVATDVYVMDPSGNSAPWSNFVTWNGVAASQGIAGGIAGCMAQGLDYDTCFGMVMGDPTIQYLLGTDDSGADFDPSCLADGDPSDCSGRLSFHFSPTCIPEIEVRQVVIEFVALDGCDVAGDANGDGTLNVLDVVSMVAHILGNSLLDDATCADVNSDGTLNVLDVVNTVAIILGNDRAADASSVKVNKTGDSASFEADGYVGAFQITLSHDEDFEIALTDKALVADYNTEGRKTTLIIVAPETDELFTANGDFIIETVIAASENGYIDTQLPDAFTIGSAYPNPFNPSTNINITLDYTADVSVRVYNVMGQLVDVLSDNMMESGSHTLTWDASQVSSGVYFVQTEVGTESQTQKIMLLK